VIRRVDPERDAAGCVEILQQINPYTTVSVESWLQQLRATPERARSSVWVAVEDRVVAGLSAAGLKWFTSANSAYASVSVRESHRRHGLGAELWERVEAHLRDLAPEHVTVPFTENAAGVAFARARGFAEQRAETLSSVDPSRLDPPAPRTDVVSLSDVDPREVRGRPPDDAGRPGDRSGRQLPLRRMARRNLAAALPLAGRKLRRARR
jgi:GNAT superfamily N-acetyltransferase